jgi:hypothetical protein
MSRPPLHLRQPRAPQAVPAREAAFADGFLAGCVAVLMCKIVRTVVMVGLWSVMG